MNELHRLRAWSVILLCVVAVLWWHHPLRTAALTVFRLPLSLTEAAVSLVLHLPRLPRLLHENAELRMAAAERQLELLQLRDAVRRLTSASKLQAAFERTGGRPVRILARTVSPVQHMVVLNAGTEQGMAVDSVLVVLEGLVGRVIQTDPITSLAQLITDPESRVAGLVERSRESGLVVGDGTTRCRLLYLDLDADIEQGDRIVTAGVGGPFPPGVAIGTVVQVMRDERAAQTTAVVRPAVAIQQLEDVLCLPPDS